MTEDELYTFSEEESGAVYLILDLATAVSSILISRKQGTDQGYQEAIEILSKSQYIEGADQVFDQETPFSYFRQTRHFLLYYSKWQLGQDDAYQHIEVLAEEQEIDGFPQEAIASMLTRTTRFWSKVSLGSLFIDSLDRFSRRLLNQQSTESPVKEAVNRDFAKFGPILLGSLLDVRRKLLERDLALYSYIISISKILEEHDTRISMTFDTPRGKMEQSVPAVGIWLYFTISVARLLTPGMISKYKWSVEYSAKDLD
ncbi:hypothetical protein [Halobellus marinus]|uniref:hypothetical protein n=1 Tax=Halobellus TaxID=1073986 RepID=UPI0028ABE657|nr:hypothetical protein [Halobellus sp. DFY28]